MDVKSILAEAFSQGEGSAGVVASGTFGGMLADLFGEAAEDTAEEAGKEARKAERHRENEYRHENGLSQARVKDKRPTDKYRRYNSKRATRDTEQRKRDIAVIDFETDPFDTNEREEIFPFVAELYWQDDSLVIWEDNFDKFVDAVIEAIEGLPRAFTVYAHNGGKFDFMFLMHKLRGKVTFKGRGLMSAQIGPHELRDSFHIIPEKLANFQKEKFDYQKLKKDVRHSHRAEILEYLHSDCVYLYDIVKTFVERYGRKLSIGQAAMGALKLEYPICKNIDIGTDERLRPFFFGGRTECFAGRGEFFGDYKLYDVNSMYPFVMAYRRHPVGNEYTWIHDDVTANTCFVHLRCYSHGAFARRSENGTDFPRARGEFQTTIHEYNMALKLGLIEDIEIIGIIENDMFTDFSKFIVPTYEARQETKATLARLASDGKKGTPEYIDVKKDDIFLKLLMNNAYGKFAQNPRRFVEWYFTDAGEEPPDETWQEHEQFATHTIWQRPQLKMRFNNVGTAASITGAARAVLMEAKAKSVGAIYADTDSLICENLQGVRIDKTELGAWDIEARMTHVRIAGKKLYGYTGGDFSEPVTKCKGAQITWEELSQIVGGGIVRSKARAPTLDRYGVQRYVDRNIRATALPAE